MDRLQIRLGASRQFFLLMLALLATSITLLLLLPFDTYIVTLSIAVLLLLHAILVWRRHVSRLSPRAIVAIVCNEDGGWRLQQRDGSWHAVELKAWYLSRALVTLEFSDRIWQRFPVVVFRDAITREGHRQLRVHLRQLPGKSHRTRHAT